MDEKQAKFNNTLELIVAVMLGVTAVLTAWGSWQASLYGGNQATKYSQSTSVIGEANSLYNEAAQYISQDMSLWSKIADLRIDLEFAYERNDDAEIEKLEWKIDQIMYDSVSEELEEAIDWADAQEEYASPFDMPGFIESYYTDANDMYEEGYAMLEDGQRDNSLGDKLGLVTVVYAVVLFVLGIVGNFDNKRTKLILVGIAAAGFLFATIIMITVPVLPLAL